MNSILRSDWCTIPMPSVSQILYSKYHGDIHYTCTHRISATTNRIHIEWLVLRVFGSRYIFIIIAKNKCKFIKLYLYMNGLPWKSLYVCTRKSIFFLHRRDFAFCGTSIRIWVFFIIGMASPVYNDAIKRFIYVFVCTYIIIIYE